MLHITNGDTTVSAMRLAGVEGEILPWRDVLHEGPVPGGLSVDELRSIRARFLADRGWGEYDEIADDMRRRDDTLAAFRDYNEVVLWFEHDLYDQLQIIQILERLSRVDHGTTKVTMIDSTDYLGLAEPELLLDLYARRRPVTAAELELGAAAWEAFGTDSPDAIFSFLSAETSALPFLADAFRRHLEELPSVANGLSRSEEQALSAIAEGRSVLADTFHTAHHEREERIFLGDNVFAWYLERLSSAAEPLLLFNDGSIIIPPHGVHPDSDFWTRRVALTPLGERVLAGEADRVDRNGINHWLGGVHLHAPGNVWRWDGEAEAPRIG